LTPDGAVADGAALRQFAANHDLKIGSIASLINFRMVNERTIRRIREGTIETTHGEFCLTAYRDQTAGGVHLALSRGQILADQPTLVRVHVQSVMRDLVTSKLSERATWSLGNCLQAVAENGRGVVVLLARAEGPEQLLASVDLALGAQSVPEGVAPDSYTTVGLGSQILKDLGVGKIHLMGAPIKYNAISGFDLEVLDFVDPEQ
jgi:3,4-dihydroxy 2-butanone 4-phosphate synthase/GTP cyclohydrolase II